MKSFKTVGLGMVTLVIIFIACNKEASINKVTEVATEASKVTAVSICDQFTYADSIFYQSAKTNYVVKPLKALTGTFGAFPTGLSINATTGSINISKSETGLEYIVWYIPKSSTDTCFKKIIISGVNYDDSIYVMAGNSKSMGKPIYNANTTLAVDCSGGCEFDDGADDDNGNGTADEPAAGQEVIPQGISIDKKTGVIDFKKSISNGALGKNPISGANKEFVLYYRLGDKSSKALNKIGFHLFYYKTKAEIPANLLDDVLAKQGQVILEDEDDGGHHGGHGGGGDDAKVFSFAISQSKGSDKKGGEVKCRPPYIIVTQK